MLFFTVIPVAESNTKKIASSINLYTFFNDTDNEYHTLAFYYLNSGRSMCTAPGYMSNDCSEPKIAKIGVETNTGIRWVILEPRQPAHTHAYRVSYETSPTGDAQDIHISKSMFYQVSNNLELGKVFNININSECAVAPGSLITGRRFKNFASNDIWNSCKNNRTSCKVSIYETIKTTKEYACGALVGTAVLDVDNGVKSITNNPSSMYRLDSETVTPGFSQRINIK